MFQNDISFCRHRAHLVTPHSLACRDCTYRRERTALTGSIIFISEIVKAQLSRYLTIPPQALQSAMECPQTRLRIDSQEIRSHRCDLIA